MVIIASLGAGMPIAADYPQSSDRPQALSLGDAGCVAVAPDVQTLLVRLEFE